MKINRREKIIYEESYKKPGRQLKKDALPILHHLHEGFRCQEAFIVRAGIVERSEKKMEFQDIRVYVS